MSLENVIVSEDLEISTEKLVDFMYDKIVQTLKTKTTVTIGLSGAEMIPLVTNELVKRKEKFIKFKNNLIFLACDERYVSLDHVDSIINKNNLIIFQPLIPIFNNLNR